MRSTVTDCLLVQQVAHRHAERQCESRYDRDRRVARPAFDIADIGAVDTGLLGERFLAPAFGEAQAAQVLAKAVMDIHGSSETRLSTIDLQTIGDILVDFMRRRSGSHCHLSSTGRHDDREMRETTGTPAGVCTDRRRRGRARPARRSDAG